MSPPFAPAAPRAVAVRALIAITVGVYFVGLTVVSPADVQQALGFARDDLDGPWWTLGTYAFVHGGFWHLALNAYTLWAFGPRVEHEWGAGRFTGFYLFCALGAALAHLLFGGGGVLVGASGAVFGVLLAYAARWPDDEVLLFGVLPLTVRRMVAVLVAVNLIAGIATAGAGGGIAYAAHLGGLVAAWAYLRMSATVRIDRLRQRVTAAPDEPEPEGPPRAVPRSLPRSRAPEREVDEIVAQSRAAVAEQLPRRAAPAAAPIPASELDRVLDKISAHGLAALTPAEQALLEAHSRRLRGGHDRRPPMDAGDAEA